MNFLYSTRVPTTQVHSYTGTHYTGTQVHRNTQHRYTGTQVWIKAGPIITRDLVEIEWQRGQHAEKQGVLWHNYKQCHHHYILSLGVSLPARQVTAPSTSATRLAILSVSVTTHWHPSPPRGRLCWELVIIHQSGRNDTARATLMVPCSSIDT